MATISSTLKMFGAFTRSLGKVNQAMDITVSAMQNLQSTADNNKNMENHFSAATRKIAEAGFQQVKDFFIGMLGAGTELNALNQNLAQSFTTILGSADKATAFLDDMMSFAGNTPFDYPELAISGRNLMASGMEAENIIPVLNTIGDAVAGIGGGSQELMDIASAFGEIQASGRLSMQEVNKLAAHGIPALAILANKAGIAGEEMHSQISKGAIDANTAIGWLVDGIQHGTEGLASTTAKFGGLMSEIQGTWTGALDKLAGARQKAGAAIMEPLMVQEGPLIGLIGKATHMFNSLPAIMAPAVQGIIPVVNTLASAFDSGLVETFFSLFSASLTAAAYGTNILVQGVLFLWDIMQIGAGIAGSIFYNLGSIIFGLSPIILGVAAAWGAYNLVKLASVAWTGIVSAAETAYLMILYALDKRLTVAAIKQRLLNLAMAMNPVALVIAAVTGLIVAISTLSVVTNGMREVFSSAFGFVVDLAEGAINGVLSLINFAIEGINKVSGFFGNLLGVETKQIEEIKYRADFSQIKDAGQDLIKNFSLKDITNKFKSSFEIEEAPEFDPGAFTPSYIDKVGEVGYISNTVDISSEDLKWMRDLAEQEVINRFTTATLAPQISIGFGDVRETADVDGIVKHIENILIEQINIAAEGVHA